MRKQEHNYELVELKTGFNIIPKDEKRPILRVRIDKNGFWHFKGKNNSSADLPLYCFYDLLEYSVDVLYRTWEPPRPFKDNLTSYRITTWAKKETKKTLARALRDIWKRHCNNLDPMVEEVHRKVYSISNGSAYWHRLEYMLNHRKKYKYLISDMIKYPAARIAVMHSDDDALWRDSFKTWDMDWMKLYSGDNGKYTSLRKTLMHLPGGILYYKLLKLKDIKLPEPVTTRMKLWAYSILASFKSYLGEEKLEKFISVLTKSTDEQVREAIRFIWEYFPARKNDFRSYGAIIHSLSIIFDYPYDIGDWDIMGLAKRSEKYHHDLDVARRERRLEEVKANKELFESRTAIPPIPLPADDNIKFLDSFQSVFFEGERMKHCIENYAVNAIKGECYLFHIDYEGEMASVEVDPWGRVGQCYGPNNTFNKASQYGEKALKKWGRELFDKKPKIYSKTYTYEEIPF